MVMKRVAHGEPKSPPLNSAVFHIHARPRGVIPSGSRRFTASRRLGVSPSFYGFARKTGGGPRSLVAARHGGPCSVMAAGDAVVAGPKTDATERVPPKWSRELLLNPPSQPCLHPLFRAVPRGRIQAPHEKTREGGWNQFPAMGRVTMADGKPFLCKKQVELLICTNSGSSLGIPTWPNCRRETPLASQATPEGPGGCS